MDSKPSKKREKLENQSDVRDEMMVLFTTMEDESRAYLSRVNSYIQKLEQQKKTVFAKIQEREEELERKIKHFNEREQQWLQNIAKLKANEQTDLVHFDVRGQRFTTARANLIKGDHYFSTLLSGRWKEKEVNFIDRNPLVFGFILDCQNDFIIFKNHAYSMIRF